MMFGRDKIINTSVGKISKSTLKHNKKMVQNMFDEELRKRQTENTRMYEFMWVSLLEKYTPRWSRYGTYQEHSEKIRRVEAKIENFKKLMTPLGDFYDELVDIQLIKSEMKELGLKVK